MSMQFFDCPNCGKSLRVGARQCHHCHAVDENDWADPDRAPEFATGGYADDDGEQDALECEFGESSDSRAATGWKRIILVVVISLLILSFVLQAFIPQITY